jgi:hypothetical protein
MRLHFGWAAAVGQRVFVCVECGGGGIIHRDALPLTFLVHDGIGLTKWCQLPDNRHCEEQSGDTILRKRV